MSGLFNLQRNNTNFESSINQQTMWVGVLGAVQRLPPGSAGVAQPNAAYFFQGEAFGVRQLAAAFNKEVKNIDFERFVKRQRAAALRRRPAGANNMRH